ncbi:Relaxin-3 receptor 1 [Merluccius polli]|uniref:Relaxin-3 receptor 1 n=1 Tax=Merluccius polli TaxID=89951 RepID=A0AA47M527_MERPO|nr:Relaxin-3 receptor 1 [Merluccius polli]
MPDAAVWFGRNLANFRQLLLLQRHIKGVTQAVEQGVVSLSMVLAAVCSWLAPAFFFFKGALGASLCFLFLSCFSATYSPFSRLYATSASASLSSQPRPFSVTSTSRPLNPPSLLLLARRFLRSDASEVQAFQEIVLGREQLRVDRVSPAAGGGSGSALCLRGSACGASRGSAGSCGRRRSSRSRRRARRGTLRWPARPGPGRRPLTVAGCWPPPLPFSWALARWMRMWLWRNQAWRNRRPQMRQPWSWEPRCFFVWALRSISRGNTWLHRPQGKGPRSAPSPHRRLLGGVGAAVAARRLLLLGGGGVRIFALRLLGHFLLLRVPRDGAMLLLRGAFGDLGEAGGRPLDVLTRSGGPLRLLGAVAEQAQLMASDVGLQAALLGRPVLAGFSRVCLRMCWDSELRRGKLRPQTAHTWADASSSSAAAAAATAGRLALGADRRVFRRLAAVWRLAILRRAAVLLVVVHGVARGAGSKKSWSSEFSAVVAQNRGVVMRGTALSSEACHGEDGRGHCVRHTRTVTSLHVWPPGPRQGVPARTGMLPVYALPARFRQRGRDDVQAEHARRCIFYAAAPLEENGSRCNLIPPRGHPISPCPRRSRRGPSSRRGLVERSLLLPIFHLDTSSSSTTTTTFSSSSSSTSSSSPPPPMGLDIAKFHSYALRISPRPPNRQRCFCWRTGRRFLLIHILHLEGRLERCDLWASTSDLRPTPDLLLAGVPPEMSEMDLELADMLRVCRENPPPCNYSLLLLGGHLNASGGGGGGLYGLNFPGDGAPWLRILVSLVYFLVATAGMAGNLLVMFLLYTTRTVTAGTINFFVFNLALAQLLFSLALPFWAAEMALDYSWPFDVATCKAISLLTGLNVYASCFFLTAMSLTRYCSVATALRPATGAAAAAAALWHRGSRCSMAAAAAIWAGALVAASPRGVFADLFRVGAGNDTVCLFRFPDGTAWLGVNHLLRGFLLPYGVIVLSYLLLLRFLCRHNKMSGVLRARRKSHVSRSVAVVVLSFCACWFPYNLLTLWGVLIQLDVVDISPSFYLAQTYFFPLANCLAFTSSCLNPVIYCLVRREYRTALRSLLLRCGLAAASKVCLYSRINDNGGGGGGQGGATAAGRPLGIPLNNMDSQTVQSDTRRDAATPSYTVVVSSP